MLLNPPSLVALGEPKDVQTVGPPLTYHSPRGLLSLPALNNDESRIIVLPEVLQLRRVIRGKNKRRPYSTDEDQLLMKLRDERKLT